MGSKDIKAKEFLSNNERFADLLKGAIVKETDGIVYVLLGAENQSDIHYAMPVKNLICDGM